MAKQLLSYIIGKKANIMQFLQKGICQILVQSCIHLPFDMKILILGICCKDKLAKTQIDLCPNLYLKTLFKIVVNWKQPKDLLIVDWLNKPELANFFYKRPNSKYFRLFKHIISIVIFNSTIIAQKQP